LTAAAGAARRLWWQVLSVIAQQILTIQNALKAGVDRFEFEGRPIRCVRARARAALCL
jgi:hypothetical protein